MVPQLHAQPMLSWWFGWWGYERSSTGRQARSDSEPVNNSIECYACTQVGVPVFHSTPCDGNEGPLQWEASAGSSLVPIQTRPAPSPGTDGPFGRVMDPRSKKIQRWNRVALLARGVSLGVDPLFFYAFSIGRNRVACLHLDVALALALTVARTCVDAVHLRHVWLQFKLAYVSRESMVVGSGKLVWDARAIVSHYLGSLEGFWLDAFVILPIPQAIFWLVVPKLIRQERIKLAMSILLVVVLFQLLPKVYHSICLMRRIRKVTGYVFGTVWWGFGLNLTAYFFASHAAGGCWYVLALQRVVMCLQEGCLGRDKCNIPSCCSGKACSLFSSPLNAPDNPSGHNSLLHRSCLDDDSRFPYGIYQIALPVISSKSIAIKILYPIFWGLSNLSTFGNMLAPTSQWLEVIFSIFIVLVGLFLFTFLIGSFQVLLSVVMAKKKKMQLRHRDMEWWMRRRQLPPKLRQRVRRFEMHRWATQGGDDEIELINELPMGLRRDIRRFICLNLVKKVPLFHNMDDLIVDNICDRVKHLVFSRPEKIIREGDPVQRMVFIVQGRIRREQNFSKGMVATSVLEPGGFFGDELLSWCLRRPFINRLPASSATFTCTKAAEAFAIDASDLRYITDHFRYKFGNERTKRTARYYSSNWRTWGAVIIQMAWRRHRMRTSTVNSMSANGESDRLLKYAAMFLSIRPHDHLD